jgi:cell shape-determining protein MreC
VLEPAVGNPNQMVLQDLPNRAQITPGMQVVTAGYADPANAQLDSLYPPGILIGTIASFNPNELLNSGQVPVTPTANVRSFTSVQILTKVGSGAERAQVNP